MQSNFVYFLGEEASAEQVPMWIGYDLRTRTVMQGALSPLNAAGYERSMFRDAVLQWMMPELGDDSFLFNYLCAKPLLCFLIEWQILEESY